MKKAIKKFYSEFIKSNPDWVEFRDLLLAPPDAEEIRKGYPDADRELLSRCMEPLTGIVTRGAQYLRMRMSGEGDKLASMVSLRKGPVLSTDDTFFQGQGTLYDQFGSQKALDRTLAASKAMGFVPPKNAIYFPNLARKKGDPEAYVTRAMGRSYIKKLLEKRGWESEGAVRVKGRQPENDPLDPKNCVPLADDIVKQYADKMIKQDPSLKRLKKSELREKVIAKHGPQR
jgi:hypothetical protein